MNIHALAPVLTLDDGDQIHGLGPLARMAFAGADLEPLRLRLLDRATHNQNDANALMDLSTVLHLTGQRDLGISMQALALSMQQSYSVRCSTEPAGIHLLAIVSPGDLAENNVFEFLVEGSDIRLHILYVAPDLPLPATLPPHDLAIVAVCESDRNRPLLEYIENLVKAWPRPVLCAPDRIGRLSRDGAARLLQAVPGVVIPATARVDRQTLAWIGREAEITAVIEGCTFPIIVRPVDSLYVSSFVDYRGPDGQFRKYRIVLIDERPYACHMAISKQWMVHYMNAGMLESPEKRSEEARFFATFDDDFGLRHHAALLAIARRLDLEYVGIDCGETVAGELLVFEADSGMTVHALDSVDIFPYKQPQMRKVFNAFRQMLIDKRSKRTQAPA